MAARERQKNFYMSMSTFTDDEYPSSLRFDPQNFGEKEISLFRTAVLDWYELNRRTMPWRDILDPWGIFVSEIMLQQTQVTRVEPLWIEWMRRFPDPCTLAKASVDEVLRLWSGLGYNRRGLALLKSAVQICTEFGGKVPSSEPVLRSLPGVGKYTAAAVAAFAFGQPSIVIETNIRAVVIHHFFHDSLEVPEVEIERIVAFSVWADDPGKWYYALMDYGVWLKRKYGNPARKARMYVTQSPFADSSRRVRGEILKAFRNVDTLSRDTLENRLPFSAERVGQALDSLVAEGFIEYAGNLVSLRHSIKQ